MDAGDASFADMTRPPADHGGAGPPALDDDTVERLLAGDLDAAHAPPGYAGVAALLAAAAAEPTPDELAGQAAAVAELRTVVRARSAARARRAGRSRRRRRIGLAVAVAVGALSTGGVAAATGHLPRPVRDAARSVLTVVGVETPGTPGEPGRSPAPSGAAPGAGGTATDGQGAPAAGTGGHGQDQPGTTSTAATGATAAVTDGRCRAFLAGKGKKNDPAAFEALAAAAGGSDRIAAYCQARAPGGSAGRGHGRGAPPTTAGGHGQGQGGPPPGAGGGGQPGKGDPSQDRSRGR
jgi:hypothetical protein